MLLGQASDGRDGESDHELEIPKLLLSKQLTVSPRDRRHRALSDAVYPWLCVLELCRTHGPPVLHFGTYFIQTAALKL